MPKVIVVSADGHIGAEPDTYRQYLDPRFRDRLADLRREHDQFLSTIGGTIQDRLTPEQYAAVDDEGAVAGGGEFGLWDPAVRLRELDREGVAGEILHAGPHCTILPFFSVMNGPYPADLRAAGARAYHRWAADFISEGHGRFAGVADPGTCLDFAETARELAWCAQHGFRAVSMPQQVWNDELPPVLSRYYEPFWALCEDLGLVLSVHAGWGSPQGKFQEFAAAFRKHVVGADGSLQRHHMMEALNKDESSPLKLDMGPRRVLWQLMLGGVFDRHPTLTLALTEIRADWLPATLDHLDSLHASTKTPLAMTPSEYFRRHCVITPSSVHRCEVEMRHEIGVDQMLFGTDFPHPEGTWPNTKDWLRIAFAGVPEAECRAIVGENAVRAYGLDRRVLAETAERIGPEAAEVFVDGYRVPPERLAHFNARAGYSREAEKVDTDTVGQLFDQDRQLVAADAPAP